MDRALWFHAPATLADDDLDVTAEFGQHANQAFDGNFPELAFEQP